MISKTALELNTASEKLSESVWSRGMQGVGVGNGLKGFGILHVCAYK